MSFCVHLIDLLLVKFLQLVSLLLKRSCYQVLFLPVQSVDVNLSDFLQRVEFLLFVYLHEFIHHMIFDLLAVSVLWKIMILAVLIERVLLKINYSNQRTLQGVSIDKNIIYQRRSILIGRFQFLRSDVFSLG